MPSNIKLSICCISYNHAHFIAKAIDSFLAQRVNFEFELVISDDKSTDDTALIIERYAVMYPEKIRVITRDSNVGMNENFFSTLKACRGEYIAICEGDDYWTDNDKLQKQVDTLDANKKLSLVTHDVEIKNEIEKTFTYKPYSHVPRSIGGFEEVLFNHFIPTLSIVLRKSAMPENWPDFFYKVRSPDKVLVLSLLLKGSYQHIEEKMGVYRHHDGGITKVPHTAEVLFQHEIFLYSSFYNAFDLKKGRIFTQRLALANYSAGRRCIQTSKYIKALLYLFKSFVISPVYMSDYCFKKLKGRK